MILYSLYRLYRGKYMEFKLKKEWIKENIQLRQIIDRLMKDKENMIEELNSIHQRLKRTDPGQ